VLANVGPLKIAVNAFKMRQMRGLQRPTIPCGLRKEALTRQPEGFAREKTESGISAAPIRDDNCVAAAMKIACLHRWSKVEW
jgi:hypothetical protein